MKEKTHLFQYLAEAKKIRHPILEPDKLREIYARGYTLKDISDIYQIDINVVRNRMIEHGIERREAGKNIHVQRGPLNHNWTKTPSYRTQQHRVSVARGKPKHCEVCGVGTENCYVWMHVIGSRDDVMNYVRFCGTCAAHYVNGTYRVKQEPGGREWICKFPLPTTPLISEPDSASNDE